jgi:uncharacterized protein YsxB (DUF464 family)
MIKAVIRKKQARFVSYEISGHAASGNGENEFDIVCADVSVLSITTANNFYKLAQVKPIAKMEDGYLYVELPMRLSAKQEGKVQLLFEAFVNALTEVADEFPKHVQITFEK